jgi:hypothetical protein
MTGSRLAAPDKISMRRVTMEVSLPWVWTGKRCWIMVMDSAPADYQAVDFLISSE